MPPVQLYSVDFKQANLSPVPNHPWGNMKPGTTNPGDHPESYGDAKGLNLSVYRAQGAVGSATNSVYVLPGPGVLPLQTTRLLMRLEFDRPWAQPAYVPLAPHNFQSRDPNDTGAGSPWAVGLGVKSGNENDTSTDKRIVVTCQFNRTVDGVRLNTPGSIQTDQSTSLESPLDYASYWPASDTNLFVLELALCGYGAANGYSVGCGSLSIGKKKDQRVFSNAAFSVPVIQNTIDTLGVTLVTQRGVGQISIRLRAFSISLWQ